MTTNSARQQAQRPSSTQDGQENQAGPDLQIPVLIRLPDVSELVVTTQESHIAWQNSLAQPEAVSAVGESRAEPTPDAQRSSETSTGCETPKARSSESTKVQDMWSWSDFRLPSSVVHAAVALSLIAVFVVAYMVIVGGGDSTELAEGKRAAGAKMPSASAQ